MERELKLSFVRRALADYGQRVTAAMAREIKRQKVEDTKELLHSLSYKAYEKQAGDGSIGISFAEWGRFVDMGVGRSQPISSVAKTARLLRGKRGKDKKGVRKPRKIYGPVAYGNLNGLIGDLAFGFTDAVKETIKQEILRNGLTPINP